MGKTMLDYIRETHLTLTNNIGRRAELTAAFTSLYLEGGGGPITIVAAGSSYNAAVCARPLMERMLGERVDVLQPFSYIHYDELPEKDGLTVVISQSGESTNAIDALAEEKLRRGVGVGIAGSADSELGRRADLLIEYGVGEETVGWVTKGVLTLDLFLKLCALDAAQRIDRLTESEAQYWYTQLSRAADSFENTEKLTGEFLDRHAKLLTSMEHAYVIGAGPGFGVALEAALKLGETVRMPVFAYELEEFLHGPNYQLSPSHTVFLADCDPRVSGRVCEIAEACYCVTDRVFVISSASATTREPELEDHILNLDAGTDPYVSSFTLLPFFQIASYQLAERLHRWERHPLFAPFREKCGSKTSGYLGRNR